MKTWERIVNVTREQMRNSVQQQQQQQQQLQQPQQQQLQRHFLTLYNLLLGSTHFTNTKWLLNQYVDMYCR